MIDILQKIAANKRLEIELLKVELPVEKLLSLIPIDSFGRFKDALSDKSKVNIIAELKKGSPSKGIIVEEFEVELLAQQYKDGGAAALSVLTEQKYFFGRYQYLKEAKEISGLPVLCKDFFIDPYQIYHAKYIGADAILLIVKMLTRGKLTELLNTAKTVGLDCLVETHDESEIEIAFASGAEIIGVNNRNLSDFSVDINRAVELSALIPEDKIKIAESGIFNKDDITLLKDAGYNNFLIGEALVKADDPVKLLKELQS